MAGLGKKSTTTSQEESGISGWLNNHPGVRLVMSYLVLIGLLSLTTATIVALLELYFVGSVTPRSAYAAIALLLYFGWLVLQDATD